MRTQGIRRCLVSIFAMGMAGTAALAGGVLPVAAGSPPPNCTIPNNTDPNASSAYHDGWSRQNVQGVSGDFGGVYANILGSVPLIQSKVGWVYSWVMMHAGQNQLSSAYWSQIGPAQIDQATRTTLIQIWQPGSGSGPQNFQYAPLGAGQSFYYTDTIDPVPPGVTGNWHFWANNVNVLNTAASFHPTIVDVSGETHNVMDSMPGTISVPQTLNDVNYWYPAGRTGASWRGFFEPPTNTTGAGAAPPDGSFGGQLQTGNYNLSIWDTRCK